MDSRISNKLLRLPAIFLLSRLVMFSSSPLEIITGYGDYWNFYRQAALGVPFLDFWTEFPPAFPFLSRIFYLLAGGRETAYYYLLALFLSLAQAISIWLFLRILILVRPGEDPSRKGWVYLVLVVGLFYSWSYFDSLAVLFMLLGVYFLVTGKDSWAALAIAAGGLIKWFPLLLLPAVWKIRKPKRGAAVIIASLSVVGLVWGILAVANPTFTWASLISQANKGSWETIWALLDGNLATGNFSLGTDRLVAETALLRTGNPAVVPSWVTLLIFCSGGIFVWLKSKPESRLWLIEFLGLTLVIFFLWSPGYSPQWVLYTLPVALIALEERESILFAAALILIHLLEWPILLSRGMFSALYYLIPLRTSILILLGWRFFQGVWHQNSGQKKAGYAN